MSFFSSSSSCTLVIYNAGASRGSMEERSAVGSISHSGSIEREREMFYLTTHSTHFIYGYMASDIWLRTILIVRKETRCRHIGYSYRLTARVLLYAPSHRQDNTYHGLCYTSRGAQAGTRNSSMGPPHEASIRRPIAPWANALPLSYVPLRIHWVHPHYTQCITIAITKAVTCVVLWDGAWKITFCIMQYYHYYYYYYYYYYYNHYHYQERDVAPW